MQDLSQYERKSHIEIQTKYLSFLMIASIALVGLVFALGVLVGSRRPAISPCPKADALAELDSRSKEPDPPPVIKQPDFSFHKTLQEKQPTVPTPASLLKHQPSETESREPDENRMPPQDVKPRMVEDPIPESIPQDEPGVYTLQVGSFQEKSDANEMVQKLKRAGYDAFLVSVNMPDRGGLWFRVRVGPFDSKKEVWSQKQQFEEKEQIPAFVVKKRG
jgi:cell division septation protein DedD